MDARQETLRSTIAWSHDLLDADEQALFRRLSVFAGGAGGCSFESAEQVAGADPDLLQSLLDKSLLRRRDGTLEPRFWMLETIREFAAEQLTAAGEADDLKRRHLDHYAALAHDGFDETLLGNDDLDRLEEERENLRVAFDLALEIEPELALELGRRLMPTWMRRGDFREGRERLAAALSRAPHAPGLARAWALRAAALLASAAERSRGRATALGTRHSLSSENSATSVEWAGRCTCSAGTRWLVALTARRGGCARKPRTRTVAPATSSFSVARSWFWPASRLSRETTPEPSACFATSSRARGAKGQPSTWRLHSATSASRRTPPERRSRGDDRWRRASRCSGRTPASRVSPSRLCNLGYLLRPNDPVDALAHFSESLALSREIEEPRTIAYCLEGGAGILAARGDATNATTLLAAASAIRALSGAVSSPQRRATADTLKAQCREVLSDEAFARAWEEGVFARCHGGRRLGAPTLGGSGVAAIAGASRSSNRRPVSKSFPERASRPLAPRPPIPRPQQPCGIPPEPSDGLEPSTPSLPWRCSTD